MPVGREEEHEAVPAVYGTADLYRRNAFRLSGLPVDATLRQVRRRTGEIEAARRLGERPAGPAGPFAVSPPPGADEVLEALQRLSDPRRRLAEEWFWLWPVDTGTGHGSDRQLRTAWNELVRTKSPDASAALHNLAVTAHLNALETADGGKGVHTAWKSAYRRWRQVLADEGCRAWIEARVEAAADPRLKAEAAARLRRELPDLLLASHASLIAGLIKRPTRLRAHLGAMRESGFDRDRVDRALLHAVKPPVDRLRALVDRAKSPEFAAEPYARACLSVLDASTADLNALRAVLGADHPVVSGITDGLASGMHRCVIAGANRASIAAGDRGAEYERAADWLDRVAAVAAAGHVRRQIDADIATLLNNQVVAVCNAAMEKPKGAGRTLAAHARLVEDTRRPLERLRKHDRSAYDKVCDEVAGSALVILVDYANGRIRSGADVAAVLPGLEEALELAKDPDLERQIRQAVRDIERIARPAPPAHRPWEASSAEADRILAGLRGADAQDPFAPWLPNWQRDAQPRYAACAWCGRGTESTRTIDLSRYSQGVGEHRSAVVPCCPACGRMPLATGPFSRASLGISIVAVLILVVNVAFTDLTITEPPLTGWWRLLAVVPLLPVLYATRRYLRQWLLRRNVPELDQWHREGWNIVR
ncbi:hypothetical protein LO763_05700 [Glycomyces sp. A-F 0318]|uniref:hypothetical protein n=1 Tax=Glycomyces amatae TaxID=2881355 RepID=UPI001E29E4D8|nr:hypothetical protein [Glycomyces amatae]MCD0443122.1 hypothetical protein [Glycomyces amatae]